MTVVLDRDFESSFELSHPLDHQMDVLDHQPVALGGGILEGVHSDQLLSLSHGDVGEGLILACLAIQGTDTLDIRCGVHTGEEHEEGWSSNGHFVVANLHIERWLLDIFDSKRLSDVLEESTLKTIGSKSSEEKNSVEQRDIFEGLGEFFSLGLLGTVPFLPLKGLRFHR